MKKAAKFYKMPDFESFWERNIKECREKPFKLSIKKAKQPLLSMEVFKIGFAASDGERIIGYKILPKNRPSKKIPFLVHIHGLGGSKGFPWEYAYWTGLGIGVVALDMRGQAGETKNNFKYKSGFPGFLATLGVLDKDEFYFGKLFKDALRAVFLTKTFKEADPRRIIIEGSSQGGGTAFAVAGILGKEIFAAMANVPSYSQIPERIKDKTGGISQIAAYIKKFPKTKQLILETTSYFDNMNFAPRITCPIICGVGLKDKICPAKNFFPAYKLVRSKKTIKIYPNAGHEGGGKKNENAKINWLEKLLKNS